MADKSREIMDALVDALKMGGSLFSSDEADELIDALRNGDFTVKSVVVVEECDKDKDKNKDKKCFETIVDALCCALIHDNDAVTCIFNQWHINKVRFERTYKREEDGILTSERAEQVRMQCRAAMVELETSFINALLGEYYDMIEPMPLSNQDIANVVRGRFIKNYAMIEDE